MSYRANPPLRFRSGNARAHTDRSLYQGSVSERAHVHARSACVYLTTVTEDELREALDEFVTAQQDETAITDRWRAKFLRTITAKLELQRKAHEQSLREHREELHAQLHEQAVSLDKVHAAIAKLHMHQRKAQDKPT